MKMVEFLALPDAQKEELFDAVPETSKDNEDYSTVTEDMGICSECGKAADAGDFCFGCHKLVCPPCVDSVVHLATCQGKYARGV